MPTSHNGEDDVCVEGSAMSPTTVYMHAFRTSVTSIDRNKSYLRIDTLGQ